MTRDINFLRLTHIIVIMLFALIGCNENTETPKTSTPREIIKIGKDFYLLAKVKIYSDNKTGQVFTQIIKSTYSEHYDSLAILEAYDRASITPFKGRTFNLNSVYDIKIKISKETYILFSPELKNIPKKLESNNKFEFRLCIPESHGLNGEKNIKPKDFVTIINDEYDVYYVSPLPELLIDDLENMSLGGLFHSDSTYFIIAQLTKTASNKFFKFTRENVGNLLGLFINGKCIVCPEIKMAIIDKITFGNLSYEESKFILNEFNSLHTQKNEVKKS